MKPMRSWLGLVAPAVVLAAAPALAQNTPPATAPSNVNEAHQTRELEGEIEQYPGTDDGVRGERQGPRIPERIQSPQRPAQSARPHVTSPARGGSNSTASIDPSEVQRVFGSDARVVALGSLDAASITRLQVRLHELGHYKGAVDGMMGPQTRAALDAYARAQFALKQRLLKQDQLTPDLAEQLGVEAGAEPPSTSSGDVGPSMRGDAPLLPPGGAPPPSTAPLPTPSSAPSRDSNPSPGGGVTPTPPAPPPSP